MKYTSLVAVCTAFFVFSGVPGALSAQKPPKKKKQEDTALSAAEPKKEKEKDKEKPRIKAFGDLIKDDAVTDEGLFNVHKADDKYYFEITNDILGREILVVTRISGYVRNLNFGGAGMKSRPQQVIRWQKHENQLLLRSVSHNSVASEDDPVYQSVRNNNFEPVIYSFDIAAYNKDTSGYLIEVNKFFTSDVEMIGALSPNDRKNFEIGGFESDKSLISGMKSFPQNVEVRHVLSYRGKKLPDNQVTGVLSVEMNQSFILLPEDPWIPRMYDARVAYFSIQQTNYSLDEHKAGTRRYITRWRLEPSDPEAYARGELVDPVKPIVYYVDPATPVKWRNALKQGVEDWQGAFEAAGFRNAIQAKDPPTKEEDPDWSPEDVRYSVIRYITTEIQNAQGPHVHDPRSGEILESDILWYHNVMNMLRNWFVIQTAAVNPAARKAKVSDEVMADLIRFVAAHEVGHTLGLPHNMGSSSAYPVDSLRDPVFTAAHGTAPSIMDYARFNYVAQPEDGVTSLYPRIGEYDIWSIIYGYKLNPDAHTAEADHEILHRWILEKADNPRFRFGRANGLDPSAQTEDLGDDAVYASDLGIRNLKRIVPNLIEWSSETAKPYDELEELYNYIYSQFGRYVRHVTTYVGGVYEHLRTSDQEGAIYTPVPYEKQRNAVAFLNNQVFTTPLWLLDAGILSRIESSGSMDRIRRFQESALGQLFDDDRLYRLCESEASGMRSAFGITELFRSVHQEIWKELDAPREIDPYRRSLQRAYVDRMGELLKLENGKYDRADIKAQARYWLKQIQAKTTKAVGDTTRAMHLADIHDRITEILDPGE